MLYFVHIIFGIRSDVAKETQWEREGSKYRMLFLPNNAYV